MSADGRFRYPLEAVLKARMLELDVAQAEEANARHVVAEKQQQMGQAQRSVSELEQQTRQTLSEGQVLDPQLQSLRTRYLVVARERLAARAAELSRAQSVHEQTQRSLGLQLQKVRALERHREAQLSSHRLEATRAQEKIQDELWLSKIAAGD